MNDIAPPFAVAGMTFLSILTNLSGIPVRMRVAAVVQAAPDRCRGGEAA
jgi:hypothetical protein